MIGLRSRQGQTRWELGGPRLELRLREAQRLRGESLWHDAWRRLRHNGPAMASLRFLIAFTLLSFLAPLLPLPSPVELDLQSEPHPPSFAPFFEEEFDAAEPLAGFWDLNALDRGMLELRAQVFGSWQTGHWLGTDAKGRDILARILWGSRTSILVALAAATCSLVIGVTWGAVAGLSGGRVDNVMMRIVDVLYSIPFIFVVIFVLTILNTDRPDLESQGLVDREKVFFIVIGAIYWLTMARVVRGQVLALRGAEFIEAARLMGASMPRILVTHVFPNVLSVVIVYLTLTIPSVMLFEAFLSFLGLGIQPPKVSWGLLAVDGTDAINPVAIYWWLVVFPALAMGGVLLALNFLGDGLRDALDPKRRGSE